MMTSSKHVLIPLLLVLGYQAVVVHSQFQTNESFPCGKYTHCSMEKKEYCNDRDERCESCVREMERCGTSEMINMRPTCKIYCVRDLKDRKRAEDFQNQIQNCTDTWESRVKDMEKQNENLQQDYQALMATKKRLEDDLVVEQQRVKDLSISLGVIGVIGVICIVIAVIKGCVCGSGKSGKALVSSVEEEALTDVTTNKEDADTDAKLSDGAEEPENDEASSGRGSAPSSLASSKERLQDNSERQRLLGAGLDWVGSSPQEAEGGPGPARAPSTPVLPGSMETPVKGGTNRPNNGQAFPDLARGDTCSGEEETPISLTSNPAPPPASSATPAILTPCCLTCQQPLSCRICSRAQALSDQSRSVQPTSALPSNPNCSCQTAEDMHRKMNSIRDTAPHSSAFAPSPSFQSMPTSRIPPRV